MWVLVITLMLNGSPAGDMKISGLSSEEECMIFGNTFIESLKEQNAYQGEIFVCVDGGQGA